MDKQIIATVPGRRASDCRWVLDQLAAWGAVLVEADAETHDDIMAIVQSLRHFATFSFGRFLRRKRVDLQRSLEFSSPIYRLELGMVGRLFAQDAALYSEIIFASPQRRAILKDYISSLSENLEMLEKGDKAAFNRQFMEIAEWFGPFGQQAMRESTYLIDKLIERF
jgi:chorismate mutase/prephenate dehydrogenase